MRLSEIENGALYRVSDINCEKKTKERLSELGLIPGSAIRYVMRAPSGEPKAYLIRGAVIALRSECTRGVTVVPERQYKNER